MRSAIVWYGQTREFAKCYKKWETLINIHKPDIFVHTWDTQGKSHSYVFDPISMLIEKSMTLDHLKDGVHEYSSSALNVLPQMYSIGRATQLKTDYEKLHGFTYDWVVRARMDLSLNNPGGIQFAQMSPRKIHVAHNHWTNVDGMYDDNLLIMRGNDFDSFHMNLFPYAIEHIRTVRSIPSGEQLMAKFINERVWRDHIYKNPDLDFTLGRHL